MTPGRVSSVALVNSFMAVFYPVSAAVLCDLTRGVEAAMVLRNASHIKANIATFRALLSRTFEKIWMKSSETSKVRRARERLEKGKVRIRPKVPFFARKSGPNTSTTGPIRIG